MQIINKGYEKMRFFFLLISVLMFLTSCNNECRDASGYAFEIPATFNPVQTVYSVGDTITLRSVFEDQVYDRANDQTFTLEDFSFYPLASFERLDTMGIDTIEVVTEEHFDFIIDPEFDFRIFNTSCCGAGLLGQYDYESNEYSLEYKLVPKKSGLYLMYFNSSIGRNGEDQDFPGKCRLTDISNTRTVLNDGADNNADLLLEAVEPGWHLLYNNKLDRNFHDLGGYCFKVE